MASERKHPASDGLFPSTRWSLVERLKGDRTTAAMGALGELFSIYQRPLRIYLKHANCSTDEAEEIVQGFFAHAVETGLLSKAAPNRGLLRSFLLCALKNYLIDQKRKRKAKKRGADHLHLALEELDDRDREGLGDEGGMAAQRHYDRAWAQSVSAKALQDVQEELRRRGNQPLFDQLSPYLIGDPAAPPYAATAQRLGITVNAVKLALQRLQRAYFSSLRRWVAKEVGDPAQTDREVRYAVELLHD